MSTVTDLSQRTCLGFVKPELLNTWPLTDENNEWIKVKPEIFADSGETLKQLAIQGSGLVCISSFTFEQDIQAGKLVCVLEKDTQLIPVPVYAVFYSDNQLSLRLR